MRVTVWIGMTIGIALYGWLFDKPPVEVFSYSWWCAAALFTHWVAQREQGDVPCQK